MKKLALILLISLVYFSTNAQGTTFGQSNVATKYFFAFKLMPSPTGELIQCAIVKKGDGEDFEEVRFLTAKDWARQFAGYENSLANPEKENFMLKYKIKPLPASILAKTEEDQRKETIIMTEEILANMWKLRYSEYPFAGAGSKGWARNSDPTIITIPSNSQLQILKSYGVGGLNRFFYGKQVYSLMKDTCDKNWIETYTQSSDPEQGDPSSKTE